MTAQLVQAELCTAVFHEIPEDAEAAPAFFWRHASGDGPKSQYSVGNPHTAAEMQPESNATLQMMSLISIFQIFSRSYSNIPPQRRLALGRRLPNQIDRLPLFDFVC